jgi:hypothetical protein
VPGIVSKKQIETIIEDPGRGQATAPTVGAGNRSGETNIWLLRFWIRTELL